MRIEAIGGENIASLQGSFSVDFREPPLSGAGLFAITGRTGAGKSTILDALCLSLFNSTPRLTQAKDSTAKIRDVSGELLSATDPRQTLRRGCARGNAWVVFVGVDGRTYRAEWRVGRAYGKPNGRLGKVEMRLEDLTSGQILSQSRYSECLQLIESLLQLSYEQFTRAVLLAQGEFSRFLKAKSNERGELLERLTGARLFSDISIHIHTQSRACEEDLRSLNLRLSEIALPSSEEVNLLTNRLQQRRLQEAELEKRFLEYKQKLSSRRAQNKLQNDSQEAERQLAQSAEKYRQMESLQREVALWDEAQSVATLWQHYTLTLRELQKEESNQARCEAEAKESRMNLDGLLKESTRFGAEVLLLRRGFEARRVSLVEAQEKLKSIAPMQEQLHRKHEALRSISAELKETIARGSKLKEVQTQCKDRLERANDYLKRYECRSSVFQVWPTVRPELEMLYKQREELAQCAIDVKKYEEQRTILSQRMERAQGELERLSRQLPLEVLNLRKTLQEGEPCPVCGSRHHPLSHMDGEGAPLAQGEHMEMVEKLKAEVESLSECQHRMETELGACRGLGEKLDAKIKDLRGSIGGQLGDLIPDWESRLLDSKQTLQKVSDTVTAWQSQREISVREEQLWALQEQGIVHCREQVATLRRREQELMQESEALREQVQRISDEVSRLLGGRTMEQVEGLLQQGQAELEDRIERFDKQLKEAQRRMDSLDASLKVSIDKLKAQTHQLDEMRSEIAQWLREHREHFPDESQLSKILAREPSRVQSQRKAVEAQREELQHAKSVAQERRARLEEFLAALTEALPALEQIEQQDRECEQALVALRDANRQLLQRQQQCEQLLLQHAKLKEEIEVLTPRARQWQQLNDLYGSFDGAKFRNMAQSYTLDRLLWLANGFLQTIIPRYQIARVPMQEEMDKLSLALQIVDLDMLNEVRPADTLSGGESFLVSLALALALSRLSAQGRGIETLFIDEGFGTLDGESLMMALEALERLQAGGLRIGVISHLPELQQRIAVRVVVDKGTAGGSTVRVQRD